MPPPGDIVKTVEDTATAVVNTVTQAAGGTKKAPSANPAHEPSVRHRLSPETPAPWVRAAAPASPSTTWALPVGIALSDRVPALPTGLAGVSARTPVVAPASHPAATRIQNSAQSAAAIAERGTSVMRGVLIALAAASAAALAFAHVTALRGSRP